MASTTGANGVSTPGGLHADAAVTGNLAGRSLPPWTPPCAPMCAQGFGQIAMAMMMLPRSRHQTPGDLQHLVLEQLLRDRIAVAWRGSKSHVPSERSYTRSEDEADGVKGQLLSGLSSAVQRSGSAAVRIPGAAVALCGQATLA